MLSDLYAIFEREREEAVEPVVKEDVAEVLRRRFFTPKSIASREAFRPHVVAALKGIADVDEQTRRLGAQAEERFLRSYPFHPDLTEVLYGKWTQLSRFQRTRGVLRIFALALRDAETWDDSPLVGAAVLLAAPGDEGLSEAARELVAVADTEESEGRAQSWTPILTSELAIAQQIQLDSVGLKHHEIEQAVFATFLHSQPIGQSARARDLEVLLAATRPDKIELEKGLTRWAQSSFWLDDVFTEEAEKGLPGTWRMGSRPNLVQMHAVASKSVTDDVVRARLLDEIGRTKALTTGASAAGVKVHTLPTRPRDIEDDGGFHYAVLGPAAASESGKPSEEACRYLDETTGPEKPRVFRNATLLLVPSREGLEVASTRVRDYLAWEQVRDDLIKQQKEGTVDLARMQTLTMYIDKAKGRIPDAIRQAYCIVVTVSNANDDQAFKITVSDEPHFATIKADKRSRIQDTAITAEALLPGGPYNLWRDGETSRRVKDLSGAFAQLPHLPKMLKAQAILDTLVDGCERGWFVLKVMRPDHTFRTWWKCRPDENALADPALELVLAEAAELGELSPALLAPEALADLWNGDQVSVSAVQRVLRWDDGRPGSPQGLRRADAGTQGTLRGGPASDRGSRTVRSCLDDIRAHERTGRSRPDRHPDERGRPSRAAQTDSGAGDPRRESPRRLAERRGNGSQRRNRPFAEGGPDAAVEDGARRRTGWVTGSLPRVAARIGRLAVRIPGGSERQAEGGDCQDRRVGRW